MDSLNFFRRNLKPIMAALTLMSMISFVFLDETMKAGSTFLVPLILAALFGGGAFVWGTRRGKQNEYGTMGGLVGAVLGLVITTFSGREANEQAPIAGLKPRDIANLKSRRESANRILGEIYKKSHPIPEQFLKAGPFGQQFYDMQLARALEQIQFKFGNDDLEKDVIFGDLLRREAVRLGINVSDAAVTDFIKMTSDQNLTTEKFREIKQQLHIGDHHIYDLLRDEMAARMAAEMTFPRAVTTPQQRWQDFRKINVKQSIEATTIPVEAFVKSIPEPSDSELLAFFNAHAEKSPGLKGEPGFHQPMRVRLAYLEADFDIIEAKVDQPTDEEVEKFYEDNIKSFPEIVPPKDEKKEDVTEGDDVKKSEGDDVKKPDEKKDDEKKPDEKPKSDKPDEPEKSEKPKSDKPADEPKKDTDKKDNEKSDSPGAACEDKTDEPKKDEAKADAEKPDKKEAPKADTDKPGKSEKKSDDKDDEKKPKAKQKTEATDSKEEQPIVEKDKSDKPDDKDKSEEKTDKKPELRFKPFEEVKDKIHHDLLSARTLEAMKNRIEIVVGEMRREGSYTIAESTSKSYRSPQQVAAKMKELAKAHNLKYIETDLLSAEELSKSDEFKIGGAMDPMDEGVSRRGAVSVLQHVYGRGSDSTYTPEVAEDPGTKNRFAYWVIERKDAHIPKFDEIGLREQVTKAWKLSKAAPKAEERARALAKLAADGKLLTEVLVGQTVTGDKDSLQLTVIAPEEKFSHFTLQGASAPSLNAFSQSNERLELTHIPGLEKLGDDFFAAIDQMKLGATAAIPNADRSAFIVAHVTDREEIAAEEDAPQRADFLKTWLISPHANELASFDFNPLRREWMESIERKYNVKWPVK